MRTEQTYNFQVNKFKYIKPKISPPRNYAPKIDPRVDPRIDPRLQIAERKNSQEKNISIYQPQPQMIERKQMISDSFKRERNYSEETRTPSIYQQPQINQGYPNYLNEPTKKVHLNENINFPNFDQAVEKKQV